MPLEVRRPATDHSGTPRKAGAAVLWKRWRLLEDRMLFDLTSDPMQEDNVIERFPAVAMKMRAHLNQWWEGVKDTVNQPSRVVIGSDAEKVAMLTACEWFDVFVDQQRQVRLAEPKLGVWHLKIDQPGDYLIELRRYPRESDLAITQSIPVTQVTDGQYVAGKKMSVTKARLQIGSFDKVIDLNRNAKSVSFRVPLTKGACQMRTAFLDAEGKEVCGAYYTYIRRD
jgi:arylsulfatase